MHTLDSRSRNFGILVLRHEDYQNQSVYNESNVIGILAKNVKRRQSPKAGGRYVDNKDTVGNVMPTLVWAKNTRPAPAHNWAWPAVIDDASSSSSVPSKVAPVSSGGGGVSRSGATVNSGPGLSGSPSTFRFQPQVEPAAKNKTTALPSSGVGMMLPVKGTNMAKDDRFAPIGYAFPQDVSGGGDLWPLFVKGIFGIALPSTNESQQENYFFPCDPRLWAINNGNEPEMGSIVCDTDEDDAADPKRRARLQSAFRVIKSPYNSNANSIALQLSRSENEDCIGGMVIDHDRNDTIGCLSFIYGGPFDVGDDNDPHLLGRDGDGNAINPLHLSLDTLFKHRFSRDMDGPLLHEGYWKGAQDFPFSAFVKFEWDPSSGTHRWRAKVPIYIPNTDTPTKNPPPDEPTPPPKPPPKPPPNEPTPPPGSPGGGGGDPSPPGATPSGMPPIPGGAGPAPDDLVDSGLSDSPADDNTPSGYPKGWGPKPPGFDDKVKSGKDGKKAGAGQPPPAGGGAGNPKPKGQGDPPGGMKAGPLDGGDKGFGGWDPDPFGGIFGWKTGKNGSKKKQEERERRKKDKKDKKDKKKKDKSKGKKTGVRFVDPPDDSDLKIPGVNVPEPFRHGPGSRFRGLHNGQFNLLPPPIPNAISPNIHPADPSRGGGNGLPTSITSAPTFGTTITPPSQGPRPAGGLTGPQSPPAMVNEIALPSIIGRPQSYSRNAPDLRYDNSPNLVDVINHDRKTPITFHMQFYGAQGGAVGGDPGDTGPLNWLYTNSPRTSTRWWQGSGNGGAWMTTPETDLADMNSLLNPQNITQSTTYFGAAPQVYFGAGLPDLNRGGMYRGYRWGADRSGNLSFDRVNDSGVATPILELGADGIANVLNRGSASGQGGQINLRSSDGVSLSSIQAPDSSASDLVFILPDVDPSSGEALVVSSFSGGDVHLGWSALSSTINAIFGQHTDQTISGTGTETTMFGAGAGSASVDANAWSEGMSVRSLVRGYISTIAVPGTIQVKGKLDGATNLDTGAVNILGSLNASLVEVELIATCQDLATPSAAVFKGTLIFRALGTTPIQSYFIGTASWSGTIDTTQPVGIDITFQWGTSDAGNTVTTTVGKVDTESP